ncbi:MAG: PilC/PilY family type IV pilus protein, partial [Woeseiaceae bacterium]|nr:PilC/PilY family type IV pilus protein [Woeseiaceae bacterium]
EDIATARGDLQDTVNNLSIDGWTPLSEVMYEAHQYFTGGDIEYGTGFSHESVPGSRVGGSSSSDRYQTPIEFACQKNYIIYLTDGEPTRDTGAESKIEGLPNFGQYAGTSACLDGDSAANGRSGICLDEMAAYMQNKDISPLYGEQNVTTYTIGFTVDLELLADTAEKGGGDYHLADDTTSLTSALTKITVSILDDAATFTAPSVPVNAFNRTQNLKDVFVSVFNPSSTVHWPGNMKKYRLVGGQLIDANGALAVDPVTGFFRDGSQSFWSDEPDDDRAADGGAAGELPYWGDRLLFTNIAGGDLNSSANRVWPGTAGLDESFMGVPATQDPNYYNLWEIEKLLFWMNGRDVFDDDDDDDNVDTRNVMGDPLHVKPVPVIYGGTADSPDMVVYTATNDGYLHAIDPSDGSELWAFVPDRLLPLMYNQYLDQPTTTRTYGLDGEIKHVVLNDDGKGGITGSERAILLFGMRRGGDSMFALDVTDRYDPQLLWEVDSETEGFEDMGQTWSTAQVGEVNVGGTARDVAIFAGGYDTGQDDDDYTTDSQGNAIFMVDLISGQLIWSGGATDDHDLELDEMEHSIPAPVTLLDVNNDGYSYRMYVGDMGGRLWRFDIYNGESVDDLVHGGVIASLGGAADDDDQENLRRFYNQVDVVDVIRKEYRYLALNVGSGYRAHPLDRDIEEQFFSVRDYDVFPQMHTDDYGEPVEIAELVDITSLPSVRLDSDDKGWRLRMEKAPGEKIMNRSVTFQNTLYFTSFAPGTGANACTAAPGQNRLYKIDLLSGGPVANLDESVDEDLDEDDRSLTLKQGGIAPGVEIFFTDGDDGDGD